MKSLLTNIPSLLVVASLSVLGMAGCCGIGGGGGLGSRRPNCDDVRPGSLPDPPGAYIARFEAIQKTNAEALSYAIFVNEWYMGGKTLGPYGEYHMQQIARLLPSSPYYVMIQPTLDPGLNEHRRGVIVGYLARAGVKDAEERVRIEYPETEGLFGEEAPRIFRSMLQSGNNQNQNQNQFGQGSNFGGNFGNGGLGGGFR